jgi:hypothetical protein
MRVAILAAAVMLAPLPALASPSCMTQSEARAKFPNSHLWWHGPNRCWDNTPTSRQRLGQRGRSKETRQAAREPDSDRDAVEEKKPARQASEPRWRDAQSRARPEDLAGMVAPARAQASAEATDISAAAAPRMDWRERWVEIAQSAPAPLARIAPGELAAEGSSAQPLVTPFRVMLGLLVLMLAIGAFELMRRPVRRA